MTTAPHDRVLLDTSVVIDHPADAVAAHAAAAAVSTITLAELAYGLHTSDPLRNAARSVRAIGRDSKPRRFDILIAAVAVAFGIPPVMNRLGFDASFLVEASPAGTPGFEGNRRSRIRRAEVVELAVRAAVVEPMDPLHRRRIRRHLDGAAAGGSITAIPLGT